MGPWGIGAWLKGGPFALRRAPFKKRGGIWPGGGPLSRGRQGGLEALLWGGFGTTHFWVRIVR